MSRFENLPFSRMLVDKLQERDKERQLDTVPSKLTDEEIDKEINSILFESTHYPRREDLHPDVLARFETYDPNPGKGVARFVLRSTDVSGEDTFSEGSLELSSFSQLSEGTPMPEGTPVIFGPPIEYLTGDDD